MAVPGTLPQRVFLLAYHPGKGRVPWDTNLGAMLRAAALADLYLKGHLTDANGRATAVLRTLDVVHFLAEAFPEQLLNLPPRPHQVMAKPEGG